MNHANQIANELGIPSSQVAAVEKLLSEGATVPFIARYRKETHGSLDEVAILAIRDRLEVLSELDNRKNAIIKSLTERELLTEELKSAVSQAASLSLLEDIYLPYRPKKRTRALMAREKGLEPLALLILDQQLDFSSEKACAAFISADKNVPDEEAALAGARDIIAEIASENAEVRGKMRAFFANTALIMAKVAKNKEEEGAKFQDYFDWQEPVTKLAGHRFLAMVRGEKEGILSLRIMPDQEGALLLLGKKYIKNNSVAAEQVRLALEDGYKRLLAPAMETELRGDLKKKADAEAIGVFVQNLRELLLAAPLGQKRTLALDPGYRTGCKVACLDAQGTLLHHDVIYLMSEGQLAEAKKKVCQFCKDYGLEAIAIGNGTASRETETFIRSLGLDVPCVVVNESGASIYSASEVARKEFPNLDLTVRGAISIGRRLMDPLAELVKIDPKSIGVGQYQHDVDQGNLKKSLTDVVVSCVNAVGVSLNTASAELLEHVSGLGPSLAAAVVAYREKNGPFTERKELLKVPRLGPKAFEQAAGFLRITGGKQPLDASAVHPESYAVVEKMAKDLGLTVTGLLEDEVARKKIIPEKFINDKFGLPTITDILRELEKPGRDPRQEFELFSFNDAVTEIKDLEVGMVLPGIVTNVTNFGAFVDVGVHQDGLVHISQLSDSFVKDPHAVVKVHQKVLVRVTEVDVPRKRIALSMKMDAPIDMGKKKEKGEPPLPRREKQNSFQQKGKALGEERKKDAGAKDSGSFNNPFAQLLKK